MTKSIMEMARGNVLDRVDREMARVINNIMDYSTKPDAKRKITVTVELTPDSDRQFVSVSYNIKSTLAPPETVRTMLCADPGGRFVETVPQIPGQADMDGTEQEAPAQLKIVKFA